MKIVTTLAAMTLVATPAGGPPAGQAAPRAGTIITANMTANSVSLIDFASGQTVATFPTSTAPHEVAVSNDGRWALVSVYGDRATIGNTLMVVDVANAAASRTIDLGELRRPHGMRFLPGDHQVVLTSEVAGRIAILDFERGTVDTTIETGQRASHMVAVTADGKRAFVSNIVDGTMSAFDLGRRSRTGVVPIGAWVEGIAVTPSGSEVWLGGNRSQHVYVVDPALGRVTDSIAGFGMPYRIGITADGKQAVVSDPGAEKIHLLSVETHRIEHTIDVPPTGDGPASPQGVTVLPGGLALVTLKAANQVAVVDLATASIVRTVATGGGSDGVGYSPVVTAGR